MNLKLALTLLALSATIVSTAQSNHSKDHFVPARSETTEHSPGHHGQSSATVAAKSTATASRLVGSTSLEYNEDSTYFVITDTTRVSYSGQRGGDLNSEFIKFDQGTSWLNNAGMLENEAMFTQTFDGNDNILTRLLQSWNGSVFENAYGTVYTYDGNNNILTETEVEWNTGTSSWDSSYRYLYTYDLNGHMLTETGTNWDGSAWVNSYGHNYILDNNGNISVWTYSIWNTGNNAWDSVGKSTYTYNGNNLETQWTEQLWNNNTWNNNAQYLTTYDLNDNIATYTRQSWDGSMWVTARITTNTYLNNDLMNVLVQYGNLANNTNKINTFDGNHNMLSSIDQHWFNNAWVNDRKNEWTYNAYNQATTDKMSRWINNGWGNTNGDLANRYYYEDYTVTGVKDNKLTQSDITLFPVPARNFITVQKTWSEPQPFTVSILDMQGRQVRHYSEKATTNYARTIDVNQLPAGIYIIKVACANCKASYQQFSVTR